MRTIIAKLVPILLASALLGGCVKANGNIDVPLIYSYRQLDTAKAASTDSACVWPVLVYQQRVPRSPLGVSYLEEFDGKLDWPLTHNINVAMSERPLRKTLTRSDIQFLRIGTWCLFGEETVRYSCCECSGHKSFLKEGRMLRTTTVAGLVPLSSKSIPFPQLYIQPEEELAIDKYNETERRKSFDSLKSLPWWENYQEILQRQPHFPHQRSGYPDDLRLYHDPIRPGSRARYYLLTEISGPSAS